MRTFKSDGRYNLHSRGFHYIVEFSWHGRDDRSLYWALIKEFEEIYGPPRYLDIEKNMRVLNDNWRCESNAKAKRRRIYLKEDTGLSMALLKIGAHNGS